MKKHYKYTFFALLGCLMSLLAACAQRPNLNVDQVNAANTSAQAAQMPPTSTTCPADGTARAAVMRPLKSGKNANVVYIYNEVPLNTSPEVPLIRLSQSGQQRVAHSRQSIISQALFVQRTCALSLIRCSSL